MCKTCFELQLEQEKIEKINSEILKEKEELEFENINENFDKYKISYIEEKLNELRSMLINDISKRENFILELSEFINQEKINFINTLNNISGK